MNARPNPVITWDAEIPLVTNPLMLGAMLKVTLGAGALTGALVALLLAVQGDWALAGQLWALFMAGGLGFFALALGVMAILFGNRLRMRYTVSAQGLRSQTIDRLARAGSRGALVAGLMTGRPGAAGSGLLAMAQEDQSLAWSGAFLAEADPRRYTIVLRNRWRTLLTVYCTAENFEAVRGQIATHMAVRGTASRAQGPSPLRGYLGRSVAVVLASLPTLLLGKVYGYGLLLPLLLLCFGLASVWFVRHLAWAVLGLALAVLAAALAGGLAPRSSSIDGTRYLRYETLSGDHWALTALALLGLLYLAWLAVQTLRARVRPALENDLHDAGQS